MTKHFRITAVIVTALVSLGLLFGGVLSSRASAAASPSTQPTVATIGPGGKVTATGPHAADLVDTCTAWFTPIQKIWIIGGESGTGYYIRAANYMLCTPHGYEWTLCSEIYHEEPWDLGQWHVDAGSYRCGKGAPTPYIQTVGLYNYWKCLGSNSLTYEDVGTAKVLGFPGTAGWTYLPATQNGVPIGGYQYRSNLDTFSC